MELIMVQYIDVATSFAGVVSSVPTEIPYATLTSRR